MENQFPEVAPPEQAPPQLSQNLFQKLLRRKVLMLGGLALFIAVIVIIVLLFVLGRGQNDPTPTTAQTQPPLPSTPNPEFSSTKYENRSQLGNANTTTINATSYKVYPLQQNLTNDEVAALKSKLGLTTTKMDQSAEDVELHSATSGDQSEYLLINKKTGTFDFYSYKGLKKTNATNPQQIAVETLTSIGMMDPTIACPITYQKTTIPGIIFVECHRSWNELGAPLLNPAGVLNLHESKLMATLAPGYADPLGPKDSTIVNTSNNQNGLPRPNDFNTIIVGVENDGRVTSINSTMKLFAANQPVGSQRVISPRQALEIIQANNADFSLTIPAGAGEVDLEKVYANNSALSEEAIIYDLMLTYIEKPADGNQTVYEPYYLAKGVARLTSGYTVKFVQGVKAAGTTAIGFTDVSGKFAELTKKIFPQANAQTNGRTFFNSTNNPVCEQPPEETDCEDATGFKDVKVFDVPGYGKLTVGKAGNNTYYLISTTGAADKQALKQALAQALCPDLEIPRDFDLCLTRHPKVFANDTQGSQYASSFDRRCYITGMSPAIFVYPVEEANLTTTIGAPLTYSDPPIEGNTISFLASPDGTISTNEVVRSNLYYEYDPKNVSFSNSTTGFVVKEQELEPQILGIARSLALLPNETKRLYQEVMNARPAQAGYYFLSLAKRDEIDANLPLHFSTTPDTVHRIHVIISPVHTSFKTRQPIITPVTRDGFTVVELGAYTKE